MRKLSNKEGQVIRVYEHIITRNLWECYVLEEGDKEVKECLVYGDEVEIGDVNLSEIGPHIRTRTTHLTELMPPPGWKWVS